MRFPSKKTVERIRKEYPVGTRVELVRMDDPQAPPVGTKGTVRGGDDIGALSWLRGTTAAVSAWSTARISAVKCCKIHSFGATRSCSLWLGYNWI